jgi:hypothetical protein
MLDRTDLKSGDVLLCGVVIRVIRANGREEGEIMLMPSARRDEGESERRMDLYSTEF